MSNLMWENLFRRSDQDQEVLEALRQTYLFHSLTHKELRFVKDTVHVRSFQTGETVFKQGEIGVGMYVILKGALEISAGEHQEDQPAIAKLRAGDFLGELSLVENNSRRTATATATEESILIGFFKPDLLEILERQPATGVKILMALGEVLGRRLKETSLKVTELKRDLLRLGENA